MIIKTIKELEQVMKLCKKQGVIAIKIGNIEFSISEDKPKAIEHISAPEASVRVPTFNGNLKPDEIETNGLTEEQLMFYSAKEEPGVE
jgi:hypothetical protein